MLFTLARARLPVMVARRRMATSYVDSFYKTALKSNLSHVTFVVAGAIVFEALYGYGTEALWDSMNKGKLVTHIDWAKFREDDDEEEEEEEEEEED
eukprot:CAMPEP_0118892566 /NCGR_PEP_ID=MMETSP1166-20130328/2117_1 /TAXON_ID=1104430 /ORGANISM="Chrysoreinhardia sp, Strain CCMP3193" /LENGTH=95 /DNA_ID=CAMNT_0006831305 /DNA_START=86 /DNA_END=373 /DNA_ORIENTATION=+